MENKKVQIAKVNPNKIKTDLIDYFGDYRSLKITTGTLDIRNIKK